MWIAIFGGMLIGSIVGIVYIINRIGRFRIIERIAGEKRRYKILLATAILFVFTALSFLTTGIWNTMIVLIHFMVVWLICDGIGHIVNKIRRKKPKQYISGAVALVIVVVYLSIGWYQEHHVTATEYQLETVKNIGVDSLRIVGIADSHVGTTFDGEGFRDYVLEMNKEKPDIVVIAGDYVDDDTSREDMLKSCEALGEFDTKYGVFYVFGNHDKGYYGAAQRGYTGEELKAALIANGVTVLEDEYTKLAEHLYILGRQDKGVRNRADMETLMKSFTDEDYVIVLDHQPGDYDAEETAGADLVISGHTHGGQFIPINFIGQWTGANDMTYGHERRSETDFIVTSGISNWTFQFKTGCFSEYIVVDIHK